MMGRLFKGKSYLMIYDTKNRMQMVFQTSWPIIPKPNCSELQFIIVVRITVINTYMAIERIG